MKAIKKLFIACMAIALSASLLTGCGGSGEKQSYTIGVVQLVQHEALDAATKGFIDKVKEQLGEENVTIVEKNASGEPNNCASIVDGFKTDGVDLIMANATPALQAAAAATKDIPILGTSITEYGVALSIDDFNGTVGGNVSGTSDLAPLDEQANSLVEIFPDAKKVAVLYCSAEANSKYQSTMIQQYLNEKDIETKEFTFTDSNEITSVTQSAAEYADVIYIPTDNTAANNTSAIWNVVSSEKYLTPVFAGEEGIAKGCGVATLSISYYDLGATTGEMAVAILKDGKDISTMAIEYTTVTKKQIKKNADVYGLTIPEEYENVE